LRILEGGLRDRVLQAMGDPECATLLHSIRETPKDAQALSRETGIPLSSVYRKLANLKEAGLIITSSIRLTPEGKRQDLLISAVTEVRISFVGNDVEVDLIPTRENASRIWFELFKS
jgi:DNA-binding transcriptional ArsR family regulator